MRPVLMVHGIWLDGSAFDAMAAELERRGLSELYPIDLEPNDGSATIEQLAAQLQARAGAWPRLDVVGFSMGALVSRYWIQRGGGRERVRRFISISGPHHGTMTAYASRKPGAAQMRPDSQLLSELDDDEDPWGPVEVHCVWTPLDLMILPPRSSRLRGARSERRIPVPLHRWMLRDRRVCRHVASLLR